MLRPVSGVDPHVALRVRRPRGGADVSARRRSSDSGLKRIEHPVNALPMFSQLLVSDDDRVDPGPVVQLFSDLLGPRIDDDNGAPARTSSPRSARYRFIS